MLLLENMEGFTTTLLTFGFVFHIETVLQCDI